MALHSIELCAGVGMLGEGVRAAFQYLGIEHRTVCYVEREAPAASQLVTLMEAGALHSAPVWSDLLTFRGSDWRGLVDCVIAGFPCQDLSIAGRRAGLNGKRSGLFFNVLDIADASGAEFLVLENVAGIASATASVVDEAEGDLEERAAARVLGELADRGWDAEWITLSASAVGANHGRARWFCFAWRVANAGHGARTHKPLSVCGGERAANDCIGSQAMGVPECPRRAAPGCGPVLHAGRKPEPGRSDVGDPDSSGIHRGRSPGSEAGNDQSSQSGIDLANASDPRLEGCELLRPCNDERHGPHAHGSTPQLRRAPLFAPGPADPIWGEILGASHLGAWGRTVTDDEAGACPWAPATKPGVRMLVDGMAIVVDESRTHQLRQVGNGVVSLSAATALILLIQRAGIRW